MVWKNATVSKSLDLHFFRILSENSRKRALGQKLIASKLEFKAIFAEFVVNLRLFRLNFKRYRPNDVHQTLFSNQFQIHLQLACQFRKCKWRRCYCSHCMKQICRNFCVLRCYQQLQIVKIC